MTDSTVKLATMMEIPRETARRRPGPRKSATAIVNAAWPTETTDCVLELSTPGAYCPKLSDGATSRVKNEAAGKPQPSGVGSQLPGGPKAAQSNALHLCPVSRVGGYQLPGRVSGVDLTFLIDTGTAVTLLREDVWDRIIKNTELLPNPNLELVGADGSALKIHGTASLTLELNGKEVPMDAAVVSPLTTEGILGLDFLKSQRASIDLEREELRLQKQKCTLCQRATKSPCITQSKVKVQSNIEIPAYSELEILARMEEPVQQCQTWLLESTLQKPVGVMVARALVCPSSRELPVRIINTLFHQLLIAYADVIADSSSDLGRTNKLCHSINTGDNPPIRQSVRQLSPQRRNEVQQLLSGMLDNGIIERSISPWASPIVLVKKKDGST